MAQATRQNGTRRGGSNGQCTVRTPDPRPKPPSEPSSSPFVDFSVRSGTPTTGVERGPSKVARSRTWRRYDGNRIERQMRADDRGNGRGPEGDAVGEPRRGHKD